MNSLLKFIFNTLLRAAQGRPDQSIPAIGEYQQPRDDPHQPTPIAIAIELKLPQAATDSYIADQAKQAERDVRDARRLWVERAVLIAVVIGFALNWWQLNLTQGALKATQEASATAARQADIAARQLEATDRPWLSVTVAVTSPFKESDDRQNVFLGLTTSMKNVGRSVAQNVGVKIAAYPQKWADGLVFTEPLQRQRAICNDPKDKDLDGFLKLTLFPGEEGTLGSSLGLGTEEIAAAATSFDKKIPYSALQPVVIGCATYEFEGSSRRHHSYFAYQVTRVVPDRPGVPHLFNADALPTELKFIALMKHPNAKTHAAD